MNSSAAVLATRPTTQRRIILAEVAGFCFGVRRAVEIAQNARQERYGKLTTLGSIVHNEQVIEKLRQEGIETVERLRLHWYAEHRECRLGRRHAG